MLFDLCQILHLREKRVVQYPDVSLTEPVPGPTSQVVAGERILVSSLTMAAHSYLPPHRHEAEQIMTVIKEESLIPFDGNMSLDPAQGLIASSPHCELGHIDPGVP